MQSTHVRAMERAQCGYASEILLHTTRPISRPSTKENCTVSPVTRSKRAIVPLGINETSKDPVIHDRLITFTPPSLTQSSRPLFFFISFSFFFYLNRAECFICETPMCTFFMQRAQKKGF